MPEFGGSELAGSGQSEVVGIDAGSWWSELAGSARSELVASPNQKTS